MCNQCSNDGNPLCETCLVEERLTLEYKRLAARVAELEAIEAAAREHVTAAAAISTTPASPASAFCAAVVRSDAAWDALVAALGGGK